MEFLSVILSIVLGLYLFGAISKIILKLWIKKKLKDFEQGKTSGNAQFNGSWGGFNQQRNETKTKKEGSITITTTEEQDRKIDKKVGEYVDFDEIK